MNGDQVATELRSLFDADWYLAAHPDVAAAGLDPLNHYIGHGANEGRDPNPFFNGSWYVAQHADVGAAGMNPLLHYLLYGAAELRDPHPGFNATFYADVHPESAGNVLLFHMLVGRARGFAIAPTVDVAEYLTSTALPFTAPADVSVSVIVPVYRGLNQTRACLRSVLDDPDRLPGPVIVVDDRSPDPALSAYLDTLLDLGVIRLIRNARNLGFVASANRGMEVAGRDDVILLNSDTVVPPGWARRLAAHAYAAHGIATVSPFSNNATICSVPRAEGGPMPSGFDVAALDAAARVANAGRSVDVPTTVGFCMYIRRVCLDDVGAFDAAAFGRGYGEEVDFCQRARVRGWRHKLACDVFVEHEGEVSFGAKAPERTDGYARLVERYPDYPTVVERYVRRDPAGPARMALTLEIWRRSESPVILMVTHGLGGGVRHHIDRLVARLDDQAHTLLMEATAGGVALSIPAYGPRPRLALPTERTADLLRFLRAAGVGRVHVHHVLGVGPHPRALIDALGVPFDFTAHDYFSICPQVNLLPEPDLRYCGEPDAAGCNACIANRPSHGSRDILSWRAEHAWLLRDAARVLCPSRNVIDRLGRYAPNATLVFAPHEPTPSDDWVVRRPKLRGAAPLRVVLLGVLADHKGAQTVATVVEMADPSRFSFELIGALERPLPGIADARLTVGGRYEDDKLDELITKADPHVVWFPAHWPETYSYTLSAALAARLPIVAADIGAFPERLDGRPETWLVSPDASAATWLAALEQVSAELAVTTFPAPVRARAAGTDFYASAYPRSLAAPAAVAPVGRRRTIVVIPERLDNGILSPCAYIRLLLPLDHPGIADDCDIVLASATEALRRRADLVVTQRHAVREEAVAKALADHCRRNGARLVYDLDDDLIGVPPDHPEAARLRPLARAVDVLLRAADAVWVSTPGLRVRLNDRRPDARVIENGLDERLWSAGRGPIASPRPGPLRVLIMGTATHDNDFTVVGPALQCLNEEVGGRLAVDVVGMFEGDVPPWLNRLHPTANGSASYPGFVDWIVRQPKWDLGVAPLADTRFNAAKSAIKTLDYAALGLAVLASDVPAYGGSLADGSRPDAGGLLVANTTAAWVEAIGRMLRDPRLRADMAADAARAFTARHTLVAQVAGRRAALQSVLAPAAGRETRRARKVATGTSGPDQRTWSAV